MGFLTLLGRTRVVSVVQQVTRRNFFVMASEARQKSEQSLEELKEKNPYFDKYADKIAKLQQTSPEEFLQRVDKAEKTKATNQFGGKRDYSELTNPKPTLKESQASDGNSKKLLDIMKVELLADKTVDEIRHIWLEYHKTKDVISAVIDPIQYEQIMARGREYPIFIFPLPREQGYEFIMHQFNNETVHFTPLLSYQVHKENAPECLNIVHYTELREKGIILMKGEFDSKIINGKEAQCLVNQLQMYYGQNDKRKIELLQKFTVEPTKFKHMDVVKELENIELK